MRLTVNPSFTNSAELAAIISNETGSGALVFGTSPTIVTPTIASFVNATHNHQNAAGGGTLDHGLALTGLTDDDHTQYALLAGRSGGQTLIGGTAAADDLILRATAGNDTAGDADIIFQGGNNGGTEIARMDVANSRARMGIGTTDPKFHTDDVVYLALDGGTTFSRFGIGGPGGVGNNQFVGIFGFYNNSISAGTSKLVALVSGQVVDEANSGQLEFWTYNAAVANRAMMIKKTGKVGINQLTPLARLHIKEGTLGDAVFQLESTATNDDVTEIVYQNRVATTNATTTTIHTIAAPANTTIIITAYVVARRTGGTAGTVDDGGGFFLRQVWNNIAGTATLIGEEAGDLASSSTGFLTVALAASGANVVLQVTGEANTNITWQATIRVWKVSS